MKFNLKFESFQSIKCIWTFVCEMAGNLSRPQCVTIMTYSKKCINPLSSRAPSQYPKRRLIVRSREVSKPRDWYFKLSYRFEIWQAHRQHCCRSACQISERSDISKYKSRSFETLRDLTERRLFGYWDGALAGVRTRACCVRCRIEQFLNAAANLC